ncbi:hypothetical protein HPULCUR_000382 [Helicostylum pulchrum]|uniref:DUF2428 domain-containing protein n=1 Tax=Helicostylum pulchrum TaxID=562976 RepID=A0ABP9XJQ0_9FUNG
MEKARKGLKPVKLPSQLFTSWKTIIDNYVSVNKTKLIPVVLTLEKLIGCQEANYDQQARCIKEAVYDDSKLKYINLVKAMQKNVNNLDKLRPQDLQQIKSIVEPIASLGYFGACENLSRRTFVPLLEASIQCTGNDNITFNKYYMQYISNQSREPTFDGKPLSQRALTIYATLSFNLGRNLIIENYQHTLKYLVDGIQEAQYQLKNNNTHVDQFMNDIQFTVKTVLVLLSRQLEIAPRMFEKVESNQRDADVALLGDLIKTLLDICVDTTTYIRECNQVAGMAIGAFINLASDIEFARDWVLGWFFTTTSNPTVQHIETALGVPKPCQKLVGTEGWTSRHAPMVFALRGLVSSLRKEIVIQDCPSQLSLVPAIANSPIKNLQEIIFTSIDLFCARAELDSSCKVIAFESMATWLQQTKEMMEKNPELMTSVSGPIIPDNMNALIQYVWDHWDDPTDSIQHKVRTIFELSLVTLEIKTKFNNQQDQYTQFVHNLLKNLLSMDWHRKVKYSLLNMLVEKVNTDAFLSIEPHLFKKCLVSMDSLVLCPQITFFILAFLYRRVQDKIPGCQKFRGHNEKIKSSQDAEVIKATNEWVELWVGPLLECLTAPSELLRKNVSGFLLQPLFKVGPQSFWYIVRVLQDTKHPLWRTLDSKLRLNAFIAVLKAGRGLDIVDGTAYTGDSMQDGKISVDTLKLAIYHSDSQVRMDVLGLLCESRKATAEVTPTELEMLKLFIPLNMNSTAPEFRQQMCAHLSKILTRLRGNLYSQYRNYKSLVIYAEKTEGDKKRIALEEAQVILIIIDQAKSFLFWLCDHVAESLYPGASYQRVATALRILSITVKIFGVTELPPIEGFTDQQPDFPFKMPIANPRLSKLLIDVFLNAYDFNRVQAFEILCQFPSPLPGIESKNDVQDLLWWGLNNVVSTRAGESDSGAMVFRLIFTKYVVGLGFDLSPEQNVLVEANSDQDAAVVFTERLLDLLEKQVKVAKSNILLAAQQHPMHGTLLALQYVFQELNYSSANVKNNFAAWRKTHARAIELIHVTCDTVMPVLSDPSPEGQVPTDYREEEDEEDEEEEVDDDENSGPKHQVILSCCWRAVKEASSLLQVIVSKAPASPQESDSTILTHQDLVKSGSLFRHLLTNIRHRGAFSAVYPAYVSLSTRLLTSRDASISQIPAQWLQENLDSLTSSNISITRRSAGLPLCILAIVSSEPSVKKDLLSKAMKYLMDLARQEPPVDADQRIDLPQVHAYNIMRTIFMDSKLGTHVLEYASDGFSLAINGFSSFSWAIRNCSVMLFSTLLQRTFGTKKTRDEHSSVNTLTGREFFVRFPDLHPYLLKELGVAVDQLLKNSLAASVHPGLYPILTLLSRMQPSTEDINDQETILTPFIPLVMPCAASAIYKTREMAARALVPLVLHVVPTIKHLLQISNTTTQNEIHGRLLQVQFLSRGHLYTSSDSIACYRQFISELPEWVSCWLQLLCESRFCNMNSALLLNILSEFFFDTKWMTTGGKDKEVTEELIKLSNEKFAGVRIFAKEYCMTSIKEDQVSGIGSYLVRESMANITVMGTLHKLYAKVDDLLFLLQDRDYEVRLLVLQKLLNYFNNQTETSADCVSGNNRLQSLLVQRTFEGEDSLNCYVLTAKLLMALSPKDPYPSHSGMPFTLQQYWDRLVVQFAEKRALSVTESVLPLLGALLSQILGQDLEMGWVQQCLGTWSAYIEKYSQKDITLPLREAVVKSLQFTSTQVFANTLETNDKEDARVTAALAMTQLLQDDDVDVRDDTACIVSEALQLPAPVHHERALELVHKYLTSRFDQSKLLKTSLQNTLVGPESLQTVWDNELSQSKVLFAKEDPNIFKEDLIDVQWAHVDLDTLHMKHQLQSVNLDSIKSRSQQLSVLCKCLKKMSRTYMQNGPFGISSRAAIFMAAYRNILWLHIELELLENVQLMNQDLLSAIKDLSGSLEELKQDWVHPLIWELLRGDVGLYSKIRFFLKRRQELVVFDKMFLLAPDSRHL